MHLALLLLGAAGPGVGLARAQAVEGFAELRVTGMTGLDAELPLTGVERFRPSFAAPLADRLVLNATIEAGLSQGYRNTDAFAELIADRDLHPSLLLALGEDPAANNLLAVSTAGDYLSVDRLFIEFQRSRGDLRVGRQALNWGSGFVVNPSDPFPEVLLTQPWKPRSGMNAARLDLPLGEMNGLQLVAGADDAFLHPRLAGRVTVNALGTDWSAVGAWREEVGEGIVGLDFKGTLGVGFWFEGVLRLSPDRPPSEELVAGLDYSVPLLQQLILTLQYYRNGAGGGGSSPATALFAAPQAFSPAFSGTNYLIGSLSAGLTQDLAASALWMQNLDDGSAFAVPTLSLALTERIDLSAAGQLPLAPWSDGGEFKPAADDLVVALPTAAGGLARADLSGLVPTATFILWSRFNF